MNFEDLLGRALRFYGVDANRFRLGDGTCISTFEAVEDESDGYRSMLDNVLAIGYDAGGTFFYDPIAAVVPVSIKTGTGEDRDDVDGYELRDLFTGHVWLRFGTSYWNDYYPVFVFDYQPSGQLVGG